MANISVEEFAVNLYEISRRKITNGTSTPQGEIRHLRKFVDDWSEPNPQSGPAVVAACGQARAMIQRDKRNIKL